MKAKKATYDEINSILNEFVALTTERYDSHAYACGYLQATITRLIGSLPAAQQKDELDNFLSAIKQNQEALV